MDLATFIDFHQPALERDEVRHNLVLGLLAAARERSHSQLRLWTLGGPGQCAIKTPGRAILLGELTEAQCHRLADETAALDYPGVQGPDETATWLVDRARTLGISFHESMAQGIFALREPPRFPDVPGQIRRVGPQDAVLFAEWITSFVREATPHEPLLPKEQIEAKASQGQHWFWTVDDHPVSLAGIVRRTRDTAAIAAVYTPPALRCRGFAGAVVAAVVQQIFVEARSTACLYTNLANPASNRCYTKLGFTPVCESSLHLRDER